jgi:diacylglycerol kinase family enzyme
MPFFCTCGMGFDAFISMKFAEAGKRGPVTYVQKVLEEGLRYKPETYEIIDGQDSKHYKAFLISVANASQYGNNAFIAPQASMSDGFLNVIIMEPFDVIDAPQVALELFNKTIDKNAKIKTFKTEHITIHRAEPGLIHFDGDPKMTGADVEIKVHKSGINIVVNSNADKSTRQPNALQTAFSEFFYDIDRLRSSVQTQGRKFQDLLKHTLSIK